MSKTTTTAGLTWTPAEDGREAKSTRGIYLASKAARGKYTLMFAGNDGGAPVELLVKAPLDECMQRAAAHDARKAKKTAKKGAPEPVAEPVQATEPATVQAVLEQTTPRPRTLRSLKPETHFTLGDRTGTYEGMCGEDAKVKVGNKTEYWSGSTEVVPSLNGHAAAARAPRANGEAKPSGGTPVAVDNTTEIPVACTAGKKGGFRYTIFGMPATAILRWMGGDGWTIDEAKAAMAKLGLTSIQDSTYKCQVYSGRKGVGDDGEALGTHGAAPELPAKQAKALNALIKAAK